MRISDWSSDVCSSDLSGRRPSLRQHGLLARGRVGIDVPPRSPLDKGPARRLARGSLLKEEVEEVGQFDRRLARDLDRKSVGWGKRVSVRVDLGGRRIIKKKTISTLIVVQEHDT